MQHDMLLVEAVRKTLVDSFNYDDTIKTVTDLIQSNDQWRRQCLNMVAAESLMSPNARAALSSEISMRTAGGYIGRKNRFFVGTQHIDTLESILFLKLTGLFQCEQAEWRLFGGTQACQAVYAALCKPGDTVITVPECMGGDSSNTAISMPGYLDLNIIPMPFKQDALTIDLDQLEKLIKIHRPRLISLGFSISLFYPPIREIKQLCSLTNTLLYYDAAHELGLIAGKQLPNPFADGADVITGSTGKSFSGPQGGVILWNDNQPTSPLKHHIFPAFAGSYQLNRVAALCMTACELHEFGPSYMKAMTDNARELANALAENNLDVHGASRGFTETNQVLMTLPQSADGQAVANTLAEINIIGNAVRVPGNQQPAIRFGTAEVTRLGMEKKEMNTIAELISLSIYQQKPHELLLERTKSLCKHFQEIHYC